MALRLLVVEGNTRATRESFKAGWGQTPAEQYAAVLSGLADDAICDICLPADHGANLPDAGGLAGYDGIALTGSSLHLYDMTPEITRQIELARAAFASGTPFFGSCWGLQIASVAAGGDVRKNPRGREFGIARNISLNEAGKRHPLHQGRPPAFDAPCAHLDIVAVAPAGADVLAFNAFAAVQAAEIRKDGGTFWGVQYHPEFSLSQLAYLFERAETVLIDEGFFANPAARRATAADFNTLEANRARGDIAWRYGITEDVSRDEYRLTELRNWLALQVRPEKSRRGRR